MSVPIGCIIGAASKIAEYFGLYNGVNTNITRLVHQSFNSAKRNLEHARNASDQNQVDYVKQACMEFNAAVTVEENENKILSLAGLAICQYMLGDVINAQHNYNQISNVNLTRAEIAMYTALDLAGHNLLGFAARMALPFSCLEAIRTYFSQIKSDALSAKQRLLQ